MNVLFGFAIGHVGFLRCLENTKPIVAVIDAYVSPEFAVQLTHAEKTGLISAVDSHVLIVLAPGCCPEIYNPVVTAVPIDVVDVFRRPLAMMEEPTNTMSIEVHAVGVEAHVTLVGNIPDRLKTELRPAADDPGLWVVRKV